jgi:hypothetical protein
VPIPPAKPTRGRSSRSNRSYHPIDQTDTRPTRPMEQHEQPNLQDRCKINPVGRADPAIQYLKPIQRRNATSIPSTGPHYRSEQPNQRKVNPASQVIGTEECNPPNWPKPIQRITVTHARPDRSNRSKSPEPTEADPNNPNRTNQPKRAHVGTTTELMRDQPDHRTVPTIQC